jgi:hypothetical protein
MLIGSECVSPEIAAWIGPVKEPVDGCAVAQWRGLVAARGGLASELIVGLQWQMRWWDLEGNGDGKGVGLNDLSLMKGDLSAGWSGDGEGSNDSSLMEGDLSAGCLPLPLFWGNKRALTSNSDDDLFISMLAGAPWGQNWTSFHVGRVLWCSRSSWCTMAWSLARWEQMLGGDSCNTPETVVKINAVCHICIFKEHSLAFSDSHEMAILDVSPLTSAMMPHVNDGHRAWICWETHDWQHFVYELTETWIRWAEHHPSPKHKWQYGTVCGVEQQNCQARGSRKGRWAVWA